MNEAFLHFVWKYRLYDTNIKTIDKQPIDVIHPGYHNHDAGPDFSNARIRIENTTWAGNIEIHLMASHWYLHKHQKDDAYLNIILHVVFDNDKEVLDRNGTQVPTLELKGLINEDVYKKYFYYLNNHNWIPCEKDICTVDSIHLKGWMERLFIERMEKKVDTLSLLHFHNIKNFSETFYHTLAGNFGFKTNAEPFIILSRLLPMAVLAKHKNSLFQIEALMFGCSGLLDQDYRDEYPNQLLQEFNFLQKKYALSKIERHIWKFLRLRPGNFPTIRISQLAALIYKSENLLSKLLDTEILGDVKSLLSVKASEYWENHYRFDAPSKKRIKTLGPSAIDNLILNTIVQFLFFYSKIKNEPEYRDRAINFMLQLKAEQNHIIQKWTGLGVEAQNAFESQALIELKNSYCKKKKCLECSIGTKLLRETAEQ